MRLVVLGLSLSSSWGNGHATTYRALLASFAARGHDVVFLECDKPWYRAHRDVTRVDYARLLFYEDLAALETHRDLIAGADAVMVGSYVPDGIAVGAFVQRVARGIVAFYDIDTPVTLAALEAGTCAYLAADLIPGYDLYFSFTGGPTLVRLEEVHGSPCARALYCSVDPALYRPLDIKPAYDLGYLGTYSLDRQPALDALLLEPARRSPGRRFVVAGPQYPTTIDWPGNVERVEHLPPEHHAAFYGACRYTLNVTRADMIAAGYSPSVRLFEAAACGTPIISDAWDGIETLFVPGTAIVLASGADDVLRQLAGGEAARRRLASAARTSVLTGHTAAHRAATLEADILAVRATTRARVKFDQSTRV